MIIHQLELCTHVLTEQKHFYNEVLGMPVIEEAEDSFTVQAGYTRLTFKQAKEVHIYHFAFNIEENKLESAVAYIKERTPLLREGSKEVFPFTEWNAHSCYFNDAAGNILEFIAHHNLVSQSTGPFTIGDVVGASELGMPVESVAATVHYLRDELELEPWRGNGVDFQPVGDEHGLFILASLNRAWFPTRVPAQAVPFSVTIAGSTDRRTVIPGYPYEIIVSSSDE